MKPKLLLLMCLLPLIASAQTKQVIYKDTVNHLTEKYYALSNDTTIKDGEYKAYGHYLLIDGFYKKGLKDSIWHEYNYQGKPLLEGVYKAGKRIGVWVAYDNIGQVQVKYDYTAEKLLQFRSLEPDSTMLYRVVNGSETTFSQLDKPPIYLDGQILFRNIIGRTAGYPLAARLAQKTGMVIVSFTIDANGNRSKFKIIKAAGYDMDEAAMAAVKAANGKWLPAILNGKPVTIEYDLPVRFNFGVDN